MNQPELNLRDIHLPEPVSWWPIAPGWWLLAAALLLIFVLAFIARKIYRSKQLKRDINAELETIKQQFQQTKNKSQLAKALSVLLRRANITYYSHSHFNGESIPGLTGENWLAWLDKTHTRPDRTLTEKNIKFQSDIGHVLISAPYMADDAELDFDAHTLIQLCESWLHSPHHKTRRSA